MKRFAALAVLTALLVSLSTILSVITIPIAMTLLSL